MILETTCRSTIEMAITDAMPPDLLGTIPLQPDVIRLMQANTAPTLAYYMDTIVRPMACGVDTTSCKPAHEFENIQPGTARIYNVAAHIIRLEYADALGRPRIRATFDRLNGLKALDTTTLHPLTSGIYSVRLNYWTFPHGSELETMQSEFTSPHGTTRDVRDFRARCTRPYIFSAMDSKGNQLWVYEGSNPFSQAPHDEYIAVVRAKIAKTLKIDPIVQLRMDENWITTAHPASPDC